MRQWTLFAVVLLLTSVLGTGATAQGPNMPPVQEMVGCHSDGIGCQCQACQCQHCQVVQEQVPIKKTVYQTKCVPVCELHPAGHCDCGPTCRLHYKKVLIKKEIVVGYKCVTKCVVQ